MMYLSQTLTAGYRYEIQEKMDYIYLLLANTRDISIEFYRQGRKVADVSNIGAPYAERFDDPIDKIVLVSTAGQAVQLVTRLGSQIIQDTPPTGVVTISGTPAFTLSGTGNVAIPGRQGNPFYGDYSGAYKSNALLAASGTENVFTAAANANGAIVFSTRFHTGAAGYASAGFLAKATAPASINDGDILCSVDQMNNPGAGTVYHYGKCESALFVPAGKGLWFTTNMAETVAWRSALYRLL